MLKVPERLTDAHDVDLFDCGDASLNDWLRRRARGNQVSGASRTYVVAEGSRVVGYYSLASGALDLASAPGSMRRNMPNPLPVAVLGRLAVDLTMQGHGIGAAMLQDAVLRVAQAADILGIRGILVHAISHPARQFYERYGFAGTPTNPLTLVLSLKQAPETKA